MNASPDPIRRLAGLDLLRVVAMSLVTTQHALTLIGHEWWTTHRSLNAGQLGVALFLGISAMLAGASRRRPVPWLAHRLGRLYPPYWIVTIACFALAWVTKRKTFGPSQFASQMAGIGLLTHPNNLINVPTWFLTVLLACYLCVFVGRATRHARLVDLILLALLLLRGAAAGLGWPWMHLGTFLAASLASAFPEAWRARGLICAGLGLLLLWPRSIAFAYTGITLVALGAAIGVSEVPRCVADMAEYSYEYYLVHGVFLLAATSALPGHPAIAVAVGIGLAAVASVLLNRLVGRITGRVVARWRRPKVLGLAPIATDASA